MIDPRADVHPSAVIGDGVRIGPFSVIEEDVKIGPGTVVGPHVVIRSRTSIGTENHIYQFCSIGEDPQFAEFGRGVRGRRGDLPHLEAMIAALPDPEDQFQFALDALLTGLSARRQNSPAE